jgi:hypothetical protein
VRFGVSEAAAIEAALAKRMVLPVSAAIGGLVCASRVERVGEGKAPADAAQ